jgi:hypothetical protein
VRKAFLPGRIFGYNQIKLKKEDEEKMAFITPYCVFFYQVMPFGLKNAGATYQRMMQNCLGSQIGRNIQVYIEDVVITTRKEESLIDDLKETFDNLDRYNLKLNLTMFFWCFSRTTSEIPGIGKRNRRKPRENPDNINNGKPAKLHEVQQLTGHIAALSRFITRLGEKALPFYALMKKSDKKFEWTEEADAPFSPLKKVLSKPPVLVAPKEREPLLLYIAATHQVVTMVLVVELSEEGKVHGVQRPVYFLSEVLSPSKRCYPHYQKLAYSMFTNNMEIMTILRGSSNHSG